MMPGLLRGLGFAEMRARARGDPRGGGALAAPRPPRRQALGRRAPARRGGARAGARPAARARRRAHREPRPRDGRAGRGPAARAEPHPRRGARGRDPQPRARRAARPGRCVLGDGRLAPRRPRAAALRAGAAELASNLGFRRQTAQSRACLARSPPSMLRAFLRGGAGLGRRRPRRAGERRSVGMRSQERASAAPVRSAARGALAGSRCWAGLALAAGAPAQARARARRRAWCVAVLPFQVHSAKPLGYLEALARRPADDAARGERAGATCSRPWRCARRGRPRRASGPRRGAPHRARARRRLGGRGQPHRAGRAATASTCGWRRPTSARRRARWCSPRRASTSCSTA